MKKYDYAVVIGRFQPFHRGHAHLLARAFEQAENVILCVGSANAPRTPRNPFTYTERVTIIRAEIPVTMPMHIMPINDMLYNDGAWIDQVRHQVNRAMALSGPFTTEPNIALFGFEKDATSYYLRFFPNWAYEEVQPREQYDATKTREFLYEQLVERELKVNPYLSADMFYGVAHGLPDSSPVWSHSPFQDILRDMAKEWDFNRRYDPSKFPIIVTTVDAVVTANNHVLLIERKHRPGMGLLAIPGGHLNPGETLEDATIRELREETHIDRSERVLKANIESREIFDHPQRSERARVITVASHIRLPDEADLPKIKGGDDAAKAMWVPISELDKSSMFEDHYDIVIRLTRNL